MKHKSIAISLAAMLATFSIIAGNFDTAVFVAAHNKWRAEAGVTEKPSYSPEPEVSAQAWVDNLKKTNRCNMRHCKGEGRYGENLYWASALSAAGELDG